MRFLRHFLDKQEKHFRSGGKLEQFYPLYEMVDTILYTPLENTHAASHIRDGIDLKRTMLTVIAALTPVLFFSLFNTGYQANLALSNGLATEALLLPSLVFDTLRWAYDPSNVLANFFHGLLLFLPIFIVVQAVGGFWEVLFSTLRKHEVNEGFLVTGMLIPLIVPPTIPLWQLAIGTSFGIVVGKEVFGGTGMNILNPALTARAFLFFAYPAEISGDMVWTGVEGFSGATVLSQFAAATTDAASANLSALAVVPMYGNDIFAGIDPWVRNFLGLTQGSFGETSALFCLLGAIILVASGIGSLKIMVSVVVGMILTAVFFNFIAPSTGNAMFYVPWYWHLVIGGFAFGTVYMATDPVSAAMTSMGKYVYGFLIGILVVLIRVVNPAFPEGMMLAILFMNVFAPTIDYYVVNANIRRRKIRNEK